MRKKFFTGVFLCLTIICIVTMMFPMNTAQAVSEKETTRTGAWVDTINFQVVNFNNAYDSLKSGAIDFYTTGLSDPDVYDEIMASDDYSAVKSNSLYYELTFNPAGPVFDGTGKLNPFAVEQIRSSMNRLINREYIAHVILQDLGTARFTCINQHMPDYARYYDEIMAIESEYQYDFNQAKSEISTEMFALGAQWISDKWIYNEEPVEVIFIIRNDSNLKRIPMGDYIADQLELIGFTVNRQYMTSSEASPIWIGGDPNDGLWHLYTGAWSATALDLDQGDNFQFFYSPHSSYGFTALWQNYEISTEFLDISDKLAYQTYTSVEERDTLFAQALTYSMQSSYHMFLADSYAYEIRDAEYTASYNIIAGLQGSDLWPATIRQTDQEGGTINIGQTDMLVDPWNPIAGSNWAFDRAPQRATSDNGLLLDPKNGLPLKQRIESAIVVAENGSPITNSSSWLDLQFAETITVPDDAWVDWDAVNQIWITAADKFSEPQTSRIKSVVTYPADLYDTVKWHDGSPISAADFVMRMIMPFDRGKTDSPIYDSGYASEYQSFLSTFKGYRITSTNPLTIEYYSDAFYLTAELAVQSMWPDYGRGEGAWHTLALGYLGEKDGVFAFSPDKASANSIEWINYAAGSSVGIMNTYLYNPLYTNFVPYAAVLNNYLTPQEISDRYTNIKAWYGTKGHFYIGTGPFYLDQINWNAKSLTLQRNPNYPDLAGKWDEYSDDQSQASLVINYADGLPGSVFNLTGEHYPIYSSGTIYVNTIKVGNILTDQNGSFAFSLKTLPEAVVGEYTVSVKVNPVASTKYQLSETAPLRIQEGELPVIEVPDDIPIAFVYLPLTIR